MALNAFKYIFICLRESGWKAAALVFPEHVRSVLSKETELSPEGSRRCYFSGACSVTCKNNRLFLKVFRSMFGHFSLSSSYLCRSTFEIQRKTDMAGKITSMSKIKQVLLMHRNGMSNRKIAATLSIDKCTVNEYVRKAKSSSMSLEGLLLLEEPELEAQMFAGNPAYTDERMKHFLERLPYFREQLEDKHVTRLLLWEEYRKENPDGYGKSQFFYHLKQNLVAQKQVAVLRNTYKAGEILMIDFAGDRLAYVDTQSGERIHVEVFVGTMPYSGLTFAIAVPSQQVEDFAYALRMCLESLGGVPHIVIPDNLKSAVVKADRWTPALNKALVDMGNHYGFAVLPARVATPTDKAPVESDVNRVYQRVYAKLRKRVFYSLMELNQAIYELVKAHNQTRMQEHPYTREERFHAMERGQLRPIPEQIYEVKHTNTVTVNLQGEVRLAEDQHYYTVPYAHIGRKAQLIYTRSTVKVFVDNKCVASHVRNREPGEHTQIKEHLAPNLQAYISRSPEYYCSKAKEEQLPELELFIQSLFMNRKYGVTDAICYNLCDFLFSLEKKTPAEAFRQTVKICAENHIFSKDDILTMCKLMQHQGEEQGQSETDVQPQNHENTRGAASFV